MSLLSNALANNLFQATKNSKAVRSISNSAGEIELNPGKSTVFKKRVSKIFCETIDGSNDLLIEGTTIKLKK